MFTTSQPATYNKQHTHTALPISQNSFHFQERTIDGSKANLLLLVTHTNNRKVRDGYVEGDDYGGNMGRWLWGEKYVEINMWRHLWEGKWL